MLAEMRTRMHGAVLHRARTKAFVDTVFGNVVTAAGAIVHAAIFPAIAPNWFNTATASFKDRTTHVS